MIVDFQHFLPPCRIDGGNPRRTSVAPSPPPAGPYMLLMLKPETESFGWSAMLPQPVVRSDCWSGGATTRA